MGLFHPPQCFIFLKVLFIFHYIWTCLKSLCEIWNKKNALAFCTTVRFSINRMMYIVMKRKKHCWCVEHIHLKIQQISCDHHSVKLLFSTVTNLVGPVCVRQQRTFHVFFYDVGSRNFVLWRTWKRFFHVNWWLALYITGFWITCTDRYFFSLSLM